MLNKNKTNVTVTSQTKLSNITALILPKTNPLIRFTKCVKGRRVRAIVSTIGGNCERGKKVPLSRNIGVTSRNVG